MWVSVVIASLSVLVAMVVFSWRAWSSSRLRLAVRADSNGQALLALASELDLHADWLDSLQAGLRGDEQRRWARLCRRVAGDHLRCINQLVIEPPQG